jgi:hypothetical protein
MKNIYTIVAAVILAGLVSTASAQNQIYSSTPNFNGMGPAGTTMPLSWTYWYIEGESSSLVIPTSAELSLAVQGISSLVVWNQTLPADLFLQQAGNEGATASATTRLLGTSPFGVRGDTLQLSLVNNGAPITSDIAVTLSYDMADMAPGTLKDGADPGSTDELPGYSLYYLDGSTWTHVPSLDLSSAGSASAVIHFSTPVANGGTLQFRWYDDNAAEFSPDHMYAIGNITLEVPEPAACTLFALGALALVARRRKAS